MDLHPADRFEILLYRKFARRYKTVIKGDRGIITAADSGAFRGLRLLVYSLTLSHDVGFACFDLGLTCDQREWCESMGVTMLSHFDNLLIFPDKTARGWQTWNKPAYIEASPFRETLWLDADCFVRGPLSLIFEILGSRPFVVQCQHAPLGITTANNPSLYRSKRFYVPPERRCLRRPNAGVVGLVKGRDRELLSKWKGLVSQVAKSPSLRSLVSWYDQGALLWALEATGNRDLVREEIMFNCPLRTPTYDPWGPDVTSGIIPFLESLGDMDPAIVRHVSGGKPWQFWDDENMGRSASEDMRILVLGHLGYDLEAVEMRSYLSPVRLDRLGQNELAESRIYLDPGVMDRFEGREYVGLASARWDDKYEGKSTLLADLHWARGLLAKDVVLAPDVWGSCWAEVTCRSNKGMERMLGELEKFTGMPLEKGPTFWSNNFICHRDVFSDYVAHFRKVYDHFHSKYDDRFDYVGMDTRRTPAFFYEAVTVHYFSNRTDLEITRLVDLKGN